MTTIENVKTALMSILTDGKECITVSDSALAQIERLRKLLAEGTNYNEKELTESEIGWADDLISEFDASMFETAGASVDPDFDMLLPAPDDEFEKHVGEAEKVLTEWREGNMGYNPFVPTILVADYILQHKSYYR